MAENTTRRRVKLYMLNEERVWDDRGTGHVSSAFVEKVRGLALLVRSEDDGSLLLESKILPDTAYQKQQETLIVWSEAENYDLALSFQEKAGCDEIWEKICQVQGKDPSVDITQEVVEESEDDRFEDMPDAAPRIELPACDLSKLEEIAELFAQCAPSLMKREKLTEAIESEGYIQKLLDLFHMCEDLENVDGLHHLYEIFKNIFMLNKNALFEIMFTEDAIFDVIGVMEYDPALSERAKHREFLKSTARFKEVIPLNNKDLIQKIHQTYRVQYILDVILPTPSVFEENNYSTLNTFIFFNKVEIVGVLQEDEKFLFTLFNQLTHDEIDDSKRRDLVFFLKELCTFSQTLQATPRENFFKTLSNMGVLGALETILGLDDNQMKSAAVDIFSYIVEFSPSMVRDFIVQEGQKQEDEDLLINLVIEQMISDTDPEMGGAVQLMGILRVLIDPDNMQVTNKTEITEFLGFFYKHSMHILTAPLFANTSENKPSKDDYQTAQLLSLILELLTFCIEHHTYHIKNYVLNKDLLRRVLVLLKSEHAFLALGALRLMRKLIAPKDEFYNRYIMRGDLFKPVVDAFLCNGSRYNLLNSAMIEMFEFIRVEDVKSLTAHIIESHWDSLQHVTYVQTFRNVKIRYEQQQDRTRERTTLDNVPSILRNNRFNRRDGNRTLDDDEEELWFEQDDDMADAEEIMPMADMLRSSDMLKSSKIDEFDAFSLKYENKKAAEKENEAKEVMPKFIQRATHTISFNINRNSPQSNNNSPTTTPTCSPNNSPNNSPVTAGTKAPYSSPNKSPSAAEVQTKKPGLVGLVDYDNDSDEEEQDEDSPSLKRLRTSTDS